MDSFAFRKFEFDKVNSFENDNSLLKQLNRSSSDEEVLDYEYIKGRKLCKSKENKITDYFKTVKKDVKKSYQKSFELKEKSGCGKGNIVDEFIAELIERQAKKQSSDDSRIEDFFSSNTSEQFFSSTPISSQDCLNHKKVASSSNLKTINEGTQSGEELSTQSIEMFLNFVTNSDNIEKKNFKRPLDSNEDLFSRQKSQQESSGAKRSKQEKRPSKGSGNSNRNFESFRSNILIDTSASSKSTQISEEFLSVADSSIEGHKDISASEFESSTQNTTSLFEIFSQSDFTLAFLDATNNFENLPKRPDSPSILVNEVLNTTKKNYLSYSKPETCSKKQKRCFLKKYKKAKTKIYRIKNILKPIKKNKEGDDMLNQVENFFSGRPGIQDVSKSPSVCSLVTTSSMLTDDTISDCVSNSSENITQLQQVLKDGIIHITQDKNLVSKVEELDIFDDEEKSEIIQKIEQILLDMIKEKKLRFILRKQTYNNCIFKDNRLQLKPFEESSKIQVAYNVPKSRLKFALMLYILNKVKTLLQTNTKLSKREIYYQLKNFIPNQEAINRAVNAVSCLLNVGPWSMNIIAQKGLVYGNLKIKLSSYETINCNVPGTLVPQEVNSIIEIQSTAKFILVVEKECIFNKLIEDDLPNKLSRPFIMITGKGFPDLTTQMFLNRLWKIMSVPIFILTDPDPHGINIMLNYKFGSIANAHISHQLAIPKAKWIGVLPSEIFDFNMTRQSLNDKEVKMVKHMLTMDFVKENGKIERELKCLLEKKEKAEIEGLIRTENFLTDIYFPSKFSLKDFI